MGFHRIAKALLAVCALFSLGVEGGRLTFTLYAARAVDGRLEVREVAEGAALESGEHLQLAYDNPVDRSWTVHAVQIAGTSVRSLAPGELEIGPWRAEPRHRDSIGVTWRLGALPPDVDEIALVIIATDRALERKDVIELAGRTMRGRIPWRAGELIVVKRYLIAQPGETAGAGEREVPRGGVPTVAETVEKMVQEAVK